MSDILKTTIIQAKRSSFIIELVKHETGNEYVEVKQIIHADDGTGKVQTIKIAPKMLADLIKELTLLQKEIAPEPPVVKKHNLSEERQTELIRRYLIGVDISDLTVQFDCSAKIITEILQDAYIEIVSNKIPRFYFKGFRKKRK